MRKLLLILLFPLVASAQTVGIHIATPFVKNNPIDNTIIGYANLLNGGLHTVSTYHGRDSLSTYFTKTLFPGMLCHVYTPGVVDSTYVWNGSSWANATFSRYTFGNGITNDGYGNITLGGDLTDNVQINSGTSHAIFIGNLTGSIQSSIEAAPSNVNMSAYNNSSGQFTLLSVMDGNIKSDIALGGNESYFQYDNTNGWTLQDGFSGKGLTGLADYSTGGSNLTYVQKGWVLSQIASGGISASNGLTLTGTSLKLGGTLTATTIITTGSSNGLVIGDVPNGKYLAVDPTSGIALDYKGSTGKTSFIQSGDGKAELNATDGGGTKQTDISVTSTGVTYTNTENNQGIVGNAYYSKNGGANQFVQARYVDSVAGALSTVYQPLENQRLSTGNDVIHKSLSIAGTSGAGIISFANQSATPTPPTSGQIIYANSAGGVTFMGSNGYSMSFNKGAYTAAHSIYWPDLTDTVVMAARFRAAALDISNNSSAIAAETSRATAAEATKQNSLTGPGYVKMVSGSPSYVTAIPNADLANSTISGVGLGATLFSHTPGTGLTGSSYNGGGAQTWAIDQSFTPTWTGLHTFSAGITTSGTISKASWGLNGINFNVTAATYNDNSAAAGSTVGTAVINSIGVPTLTATNTGITFNNVPTLFVAGAPLCSGCTITNPISVLVNSGISVLGGGVATNTSMTVGNLYSQAASSIGATTSPSAQLPGATTVWFRTLFNGTTSQTLTPNTDFSAVIVGAMPINIPTTGVTPWISNFALNAPIITTSGGTATNAATLLINGAPTGATNNYAIYSSSGNSIFGGTIQSGIAGTSLGTFKLAGNTSGTISILPQAAAGTYNFNLPITAGTAGQVLTSQAGGSTAMTWTSVQIPITLTTTGTSGAATFSSGTLNIPQYSGPLTVASSQGTTNTTANTNVTIGGTTAAPTILVGYYRPMLTSTASAQAMGYGYDYVATGTATGNNFYLPNLSGSIYGRIQSITVYNRNTQNVTINSAASPGTADIYKGGTTVTSFVLAPGTFCTLTPDGTYFLYN